MMIVNVPIEPIKNRYSSQWCKWFDLALASRAKIKGDGYKHIFPAPMTSKIREGAFLDVIGTVNFKAKQIAEIAKLIDSQHIPRKGRVVFLFQDGWFPIEQLAYMRDLLGCHDWKFVGIFHAGTYDKWDLLGRKGLHTWGADLERSWFKIYDRIIVATQYHVRLLVEERQVPDHKISVLNWPVEVGTVRNKRRRKIVVFPHRLDPEKQPDVFRDLAQALKKFGYRFVMTKDRCITREDYYDTLARSEIAVSAALQETFGIAMVEAVQLGCYPLVPDRLSYRELYPLEFRYKDEKDLVDKLKYRMAIGYRESYLSRHFKAAFSRVGFFEGLRKILEEV